MSIEELNTLREEVAPAADVETVTEAPPPDDVAMVADPVLCSAMAQLVMGVSVPICRKVRVTDLDRSEGDAIGAALAQLITVYDVGPKDPKGAAWLGIGLTMVGVIGNRRPLPPQANVDPPPPIVAPPPPKFGQPEQMSLG